jgi:D-aspartate ligase
MSEAVSDRAVSVPVSGAALGAGNDGAIIIGGDYRALGMARSLGRRRVPVWVLWEREEWIATASRYVRRSLAIGRRGEPLHEELLRIARERGVAGWTLFPTSDRAVAAVARNHDELGRIFRMTTPPWDALRWAHDKRLTHQLAKEAGLATPETFFPASRAELEAHECEFPVILKPAVKEDFNRFTAAKAWRVDDRRSLLARYDEASMLVPPETIMVQELIPGDGGCQLSFAALCAEGQPVASVVARRIRQFPSDFGRASTFVETIDDPGVVEASRRVLGALGATGLVEVEFKRDPRSDVLKLLDINPRVWGWHTLGAKAGVDFPYLLWRLVHGDSVQTVQGVPGVKWKRLSWDLVTAASDILRGDFAVRDYLASFRGPRVAAIFAPDDPIPGLMEAPLLAFVLCARLARGNGV